MMKRNATKVTLVLGVVWFMLAAVLGAEHAAADVPAAAHPDDPTAILAKVDQEMHEAWGRKKFCV
jgi:hypothetical protein